MKKIIMLTFSILYLVISTAGVSNALMITGGTEGSIPGNAYNDLLGNTSMDGLYGAQLEFSPGEEITFEFLGKEAAWNNAFYVNSTRVFTNNGSNPGDSQTFTVGTNFNFSFLADLGYQGSVVNGSNPDDSGAGVPGPNFFVSHLTETFTLGQGSILGSELGAGIYLWLDDGGANSDDNHDDMLIRVSSSAPAPVPEPATILLMGSGLLLLVGYNRKRFNKNS